MENFIRKVVVPSIGSDWKQQFVQQNLVGCMRLTSLLHAALTCGDKVGFLVYVDSVSKTCKLVVKDVENDLADMFGEVRTEGKIPPDLVPLVYIAAIKRDQSNETSEFLQKR